MFFIPCIKWNKHYYVRTSCCNTLYELDPEMGKAIARGEQVLIRPEHLQRISKVTYGYNYKHCYSQGPLSFQAPFHFGFSVERFGRFIVFIRRSTLPRLMFMP